MDIHKYTLQYSSKGRIGAIKFLSNDHNSDVKRTASRLARVRGINLNACQYSLKDNGSCKEQ